MMENPWMRPPRREPRPGFPCGRLTCAKNPHFSFQHSLGTKREILGRILHSLWISSGRAQRGDTAMSPNSAHPQPCHPISPKTGMSRSGEKPLLEQPHDPTTRKSQELPRPRGFPAFPALPRPPLEQRENYNPLLLNSTRALK